MASQQYQIIHKQTGQLLKAGTMRLTTRKTKNHVAKGFNSATISKKMHNVCDTFNLKMTDLEMIFFEKSA